MIEIKNFFCKKRNFFFEICKKQKKLPKKREKRISINPDRERMNEYQPDDEDVFGVVRERRPTDRVPLQIDAGLLCQRSLSATGHAFEVEIFAVIFVLGRLVKRAATVELASAGMGELNKKE